MKKLKQGQTIYRIDYDFNQSPIKRCLAKVFLHSQKQHLPPKGRIIQKMPVSIANDLIAKHGARDVFLSKRKAQKRLKDLNCGRAS